MRSENEADARLENAVDPVAIVVFIGKIGFDHDLWMRLVIEPRGQNIGERRAGNAGRILSAFDLNIVLFPADEKWKLARARRGGFIL